MPGWTGDLVVIPDTGDRITQKAGVAAPALHSESESPAWREHRGEGSGVREACRPEV